MHTVPVVSRLKRFVYSSGYSTSKKVFKYWLLQFLCISTYLLKAPRATPIVSLLHRQYKYNSFLVWRIHLLLTITQPWIWVWHVDLFTKRLGVLSLCLSVCLPQNRPTILPPQNHMCTPTLFTCISGVSNTWGSWHSHLNEVTTDVLLNQRPCETYLVRLGQVKTEQNYCTESRERVVKEHVRCFREKQLFDGDEWLIWSLQGKTCSNRRPCSTHNTERTVKVSMAGYIDGKSVEYSGSSRYLISHANPVKFNCFRLGIHFTSLFS